MARISCGHCGGDHATVAEVRACAQGHPAVADADGYEPEPTWVTAPADQAVLDLGPGPSRAPARPSPARAPARAPSPPPPPSPPAVRVPAPATAFAGPEALGRWALVAPGQAVPAPWDQAERITVGAADTLDPGRALAALLARFHGRQRTVVELGWDLEGPAEVVGGPAWDHAPTLLLGLERLRHVVAANSVDLRGDEARWAWAELAVGAGAAADPTGAADVVLPDGRRAWCDGGPLQRFAPEDVADAAVIPRLTLERGGLEPLGTGPVDAELAPDQRAAVAHPGGSARIIAPAGSGKTRVLTERARHLLAQWNLPATACCVVAFNERAAAEVRARTPDLPGLQVRTLNALGLAILDGRAPFAPRAGGRHTVVDERMQRELLGQLVEVPRRANTDPMAPWLDALSEVRLRLRPPSEVEADYGGDVDGLPDVVERYRAALRDRHAVDFDEQIATAVEVLLTEPGVRAAAQRACRVLLVDEFQDLAPAHLLLVRLLASPDLAVFGVGDDDQTIYGFSGATPRWLVDYAELFPGAGDHPLEVNYRCPAPVVQGAVALLARNQVRVPKTIRAAPGRAGDGSAAEGLTIVTADEATGETIRATVAAVRAALDAGAAPNEIAVLTRVNASLAAPQVALRHHGIPVERALDERALERTGTRAALAWLRLAANPSRFRADDVREAARRPPGGRSGKLLDWMAEQRTVPALRALSDRLQGRDAEKVASFVDDLEGLLAVAAHADTVALLRAVRALGLDESMSALDGYQRTPKQSAHLDDLDALIELATLCPAPGEFPGWLRTELARDGDPNGVRLATVHKVKGREWPYVVVHGAGSTQFPHRLAEDVEEERRVFHVAITRCSRACTVVVPSSPSPFVAELSGATPVVRGREPVRSVTGVPASTTAGKRWTGKSGAVGTAPSGPAPSPALVEALRAWRLQRSRTDQVPAYVVMTDATLDEIARARPRSLVALGRVRGIGPAKLERYGDDVLAIVDSAAS